MLQTMIQEVADKYSCSEQDITVGPLFETSVFLEMGPYCKSCTNSLQCKNDLIDKITQEFNWINQVRIY